MKFKFTPGFILIYYGLAAVALFFLVATLAPEIGKQFGKLSQSKKGQESRAGGIEGRVRYFEKMESTFDKFAATQTGKDFANAHYKGGLIYYPRGDSSYIWYRGEGFFYRNSYGLAVTGDDSGLGLSVVLKSATGQPCYLPDRFRYAGDAGNPAFRTTMINHIKGRLHDNAWPQYDGVYLDDVNLDMNAAMVCDGGGGPMDSRTGQPMTADNWKRYMVEYLEQIRASTGEKIFHNTVSYSVFPYSDLLLVRSIKAANYIEMEFAFADGGLNNNGSDDKYSWQAKMDWIDFVHSNGADLLHQNYWHGDDNLTAQQEKFGLAMYLLTSNGNDFFATYDGDHPDNWNSAHDLDLGSATNGRYLWNGLLRRDFTGGFAVVNPIGSTTKTVSLGGSYNNLSGAAITSLTLNARNAEIFVVSPSPSPSPK